MSVHPSREVVRRPWLALGIVLLACHRNRPAQRDTGVTTVTRETTTVSRDTPGVVDRSVAALFKDTLPSHVFYARGRIFRPQEPTLRKEFLTALKTERDLWRSKKLTHYKYLLRVACFCPGTRGWLLIEVDNARVLRAWYPSGKSAELTDWNTISIDALYDNLERMGDKNFEVQIDFDSRWHFPTYTRASGARMPDGWSIIDARALRLIP